MKEITLNQVQSHAADLKAEISQRLNLISKEGKGIIAVKNGDELIQIGFED